MAGKDLIAKTLHYQSLRQSQPFLAINCAAIPEALLESELFGYEKGAFTDARAQKRGLFELADKGTLLLDEIGEMPLSLQAKLLRVLEDQCFRRLGGLRRDGGRVSGSRTFVEQCMQTKQPLLTTDAVTDDPATGRGDLPSPGARMAERQTQAA